MANETKRWDLPEYFTWTSISLNYPDNTINNGSSDDVLPKSTISTGGGGGDTSDYDNYFIGGSGDGSDSEIGGIGYFGGDIANSTTGLPQVLVSEFALFNNVTTTVDGEEPETGSGNNNNNLTTIYNQITDDLLLLNQTNNGTSDEAAKVSSVEGGSNFMLLFEDFGEYFYNYNGTGFNESSISTLPYNCSFSNASCPGTEAGEFVFCFVFLPIPLYSSFHNYNPYNSLISRAIHVKLII